MAGSRRILTSIAAALPILATAAAPAAAQDISISFGQGGGLTERLLQLCLLYTSDAADE